MITVRMDLLTELLSVMDAECYCRLQQGSEGRIEGPARAVGEAAAHVAAGGR